MEVGSLVGVAELVLVLGAVLGWAIWELVKLRRGRRRRDRQPPR